MKLSRTWLWTVSGALLAHAGLLMMPWPEATPQHPTQPLHLELHTEAAPKDPPRATTAAALERSTPPASDSPEPVSTSTPAPVRVVRPSTLARIPATPPTTPVVAPHAEAPTTPASPLDIRATVAASPTPPSPTNLDASKTPDAFAPAPDAATDAAYRQRLEAHLGRFRQYPALARQRGQQGTVEVAFRVDDAGNLLQASLRRGSPYPLLNREALALLQRASPLPPPDRDVPRDWTLPIEFRLP